jgi:hypothetical protein
MPSCFLALTELKKSVCLRFAAQGAGMISVFRFAKFWFDVIFLKTDCSRSCLFHSVFFGSLYDFDELSVQ